MADCGCKECDGRTPEFPRVEKLLREYILQRLSTGEPFYISRDLNSDVLAPTGTLGLPFLIPLIGAVASVGGAVAAAAAPIAAVAGTAGAIKALTSGGGGGSSASAQSVALTSQVEQQVLANLQAQGIKLPSSIAGQVVQAGVMDVFGPGSSQWVIMAGLILLGVMLMR